MAQAGEDSRLCHPFSFRIRLSVTTRARDDGTPRPAEQRNQDRCARTARRRLPNLDSLRRILPQGLIRARAVLCWKVSAMNLHETGDAPAASADGRALRVLRILLPVIVAALGTAAWELAVRLFDIQPYVLPGPVAVFRTLFNDWGVLSQSLLVTLLTTFEGFVAASLGGIALALLFNLSKVLEYSLFPYAVILQVTPVIAIAPLLLIYLPQQTAVVVCAWIVGFFPVLSNTTLGLNSVDRNLAGLFQLYGASRLQTLRLLKLPSALPY